MWCDHSGSNEKVHTHMEYFTIVQPESVTAEGLFEVLGCGLWSLGIEEVSAEQCTKLVVLGHSGQTRIKCNSDLCLWGWGCCLLCRAVAMQGTSGPSFSA